jgi:hypothetical protein
MQFAAGWGDKLPPPLNDAGMVFLSETIKGGSGSYAFLIRRSLAQRSFWAAAILALPSAVI